MLACALDGEGGKDHAILDALDATIAAIADRESDDARGDALDIHSDRRWFRSFAVGGSVGRYGVLLLTLLRLLIFLVCGLIIRGQRSEGRAQIAAQRDEVGTQAIGEAELKLDRADHGIELARADEVEVAASGVERWTEIEEHWLGGVVRLAGGQLAQPDDGLAAR